jgi:hypothetical protein
MIKVSARLKGGKAKNMLNNYRTQHSCKPPTPTCIYLSQTSHRRNLNGLENPKEERKKKKKR